MVHLTKLDLSENRIDALPSAILSLTALSKLSISNNLLKNLDFLGGHGTSRLIDIVYRLIDASLIDED